MTINIMNQYIELTKKQITTYMKLTFGKNFEKKYNEEFIEKYINIRYYNYYDDFVNSTLRKKILSILRETAENLVIDNIEDRILIEEMCTFFYYVLYFDNVVYCKELKEKTKKVAKLRKKVLKPKEDEKVFEKTLYEKIEEFNNEKEKLIKKFDTQEFYIKTRNYENKYGTYRVNLKYNIPIPIVYSEYAKNKAFNIGIVNEDKLIIEYYLTVIKIIDDINKLNFKRQYIVEFSDTLLKKPKKLKSLLNIINNGAIQDKISLKIRYEKYIENKEEIHEIMRNGYKIAIILDNSFEVNYKNIESLEMFKYIIINQDVKYYQEFKKNTNKKIENKLIEI